MFVLYLDEEQLAELDQTEPNYHRVPLDVRLPPLTSGVSIELLDSGELIGAAAVYSVRHGYLLDKSGRKVELTSQPELITDVLERLHTVAN